MNPPPPRSTLFPYTTLFRSSGTVPEAFVVMVDEMWLLPRRQLLALRGGAFAEREKLDRKSTRLNSSHGYISYAVFCLKKNIRVGENAVAFVDMGEGRVMTTE